MKLDRPCGNLGAVFVRYAWNSLFGWRAEWQNSRRMVTEFCLHGTRVAREWKRMIAQWCRNGTRIAFSAFSVCSLVVSCSPIPRCRLKLPPRHPSRLAVSKGIHGRMSHGKSEHTPFPLYRVRHFLAKCYIALSIDKIPCIGKLWNAFLLSQACD